uniref:Uncharacterized protein n=1 Tax=Rhizophora mucronata TaxID=61149 RepID=A0A2P2QN69_RHIMU
MFLLLMCTFAAAYFNTITIRGRHTFSEVDEIDRLLFTFHVSSVPINH